MFLPILSPRTPSTPRKFQRFLQKEKILLGLFALFSMVLPFQTAQAAPCCGKNTAGLPSLILGEDRFQTSLSYSYAKTFKQPRQGKMIPVPSSVSEYDQVVKFQPAFLVSDRLQVGAGFSWLSRNRSANQQILHQVGVGDSFLSAAYEMLPEWEYSAIRPHGFLFSTLTLPTGTSRYEVSSGQALKVTGNGFYSTSLGFLLLKNGRQWDAFSFSDFHYSFSRTFAKNYTVSPGWGTTFGAGLGWNFQALPLRVGTRLTGNYDQKPQGTPPRGSVQMAPLGSGFPYLSMWEAGFEAGYLLSRGMSLQLAYADQTLFTGKGTNENRSFSLTFQHRWER